MGLIQFGQKREKYPKVAWNKPLTRGLRNALLFDGGVFDAAQQRVFPITAAYGTPTWIATPEGMALSTPSSAAAIVAVSEDWSGPSTTIWRGRLNGMTSPWGAYWAKAGTGSATQISVGRYGTSDNFYLGRQATVQQLSSSSISGSSGGWVTLAVVVESQSTSGSVVLYRNGVVVQGVASAYVQTTGAGSLYLGCESTAASSTYAADAHWNSFFRFDRILSAAEIAAIGSDPESVLLERRRIWVPVGSSSGSGSSGLIQFNKRLLKQPVSSTKAAAGVSAAWTGPSVVDAVSGYLPTLTADAVRKSSAIGQSLEVTGQGSLDRVILKSYVGKDQISSGDFTVVALVTLQRTDIGYSVLSKWNTGSQPGTNEWFLGSGGAGGFASGDIDFWIEVGSTIHRATVTSAGWSTGVPYLLVGRRRGTTITVDRCDLNTGVWHSRSTTDAGITTINTSSARKLTIGEIASGAGVNADVGFYAGGIFPRALSDAEVASAATPALWGMLFAPKRVLVPFSTSAPAANTYTQTLIGSIASQGSLLYNAVFRRLLSGSLTNSGSLVKQTSKLFTGSTTGSGSLSATSVLSKLLSGSITYSGALIKQTYKLFSGSATSSGTLKKDTSKSLSGSIVGVGSGSGTTGATQDLAGSITASGTLVKAITYLRSYASSLTLVGNLSKRTFRTLSGSITAVGEVTKQMYVRLAGSITALGDLVTFKFTPPVGLSVISTTLRSIRRFIGRR